MYILQDIHQRNMIFGSLGAKPREVDNISDFTQRDVLQMGAEILNVSWGK